MQQEKNLTKTLIIASFTSTIIFISCLIIFSKPLISYRLDGTLRNLNEITNQAEFMEFHGKEVQRIFLEHGDDFIEIANHISHDGIVSLSVPEDLNVNPTTTKLRDSDFAAHLLPFIRGKMGVLNQDKMYYLFLDEEDLVITMKNTEGLGKRDEPFAVRCQFYAYCSDNRQRNNNDEINVIVSDFYRDLLTDKHVITMSYPIFDKTGQHAFDFNLDIYAAWFSEYIKVNNNNNDYRILDVINIDYQDFRFSYVHPIIISEEKIILFHYSFFEYLKDSFWMLIVSFVASASIVSFYFTLRSDKQEIEQTKRIMYEDSLTGLSDRKLLNREDIRTKLNKGGSLIYVDIDKLKYLNDNFGHDTGDAVINYVAKFLKSKIRSTDICIRMGGDEFLIILIECTKTKANKIMAELESIGEQAMNKVIGNVSISLGCETFTTIEDFDSAVTSADNKMYQHKKS